MARPPKKKPHPPRLPGQKFATLDEIFDANFARKYRSPSKPVGFEKDPILLDMLIKCAKLAIGDYNTQHHTDYRFVKIEMATFQLAYSAIFHVTFECRNAKINDQYTSFQATVYHNKHTRNVERIRIKGSSTWCPGIL
ncbi:hypothetical protein TSUD_116150 [Trifolium subterraneum]|uniref:Cystatin domain-containing protein n=1 Tax=Trifolium subterraneum TaxID=3900 RepID=A0A2Z6LYY2_TRISU|nr:hypothetical protein TSUD_116150 [Trifolium subterraneum]